MAIGAAVLAVTILGVQCALAAHYQLMSPVGEEISASRIHVFAPASQGAFQRASRTRRIALLPQTVSGKGLSRGDELDLHLFGDTVLTANVDRVSKNIMGTTSIRARINGYPYGYLLLSSHAGRSLAIIAIPEKALHYRIIYLPEDDTHYLLDFAAGDPDALESAHPLLPPAMPLPPSDEALLSEDHSLPDLDVGVPAVVDVLIVYTQAARLWADGSGGIASVIAQAMEFAHLAHDNSDTQIVKRLVHAAEVSYVESGDSSTDLRRLTSSEDGYMDCVHEWRNQYGADLVVLLARLDDVGGRAWTLDNRNGRPSYGFSITRVQQAGWTATMLHEMGHNMGCHHHKEQNYSPGPTKWSNWSANTWSAGWRWVGNDSKRYSSVMTYESGEYFADGLNHTRVMHFSDPDIYHQDVPTGCQANGNNARTLRETRNTVAAYRPTALCSLEVVSAYGHATPHAGAHDYQYGVELVCAVTSPITLVDMFSNVTVVCTGWTGTGSVPSGGSGTSTGPFRMTADSAITWHWIVTDIVVSNQIVTGAVSLDARDSITAGDGYLIKESADVDFRVGHQGTVFLKPGFESEPGASFRVDIMLSDDTDRD